MSTFSSIRRGDGLLLDEGGIGPPTGTTTTDEVAVVVGEHGEGEVAIVECGDWK